MTKMRALITGMEGFVGPYLAKELIKRGYIVAGTYLKKRSDSIPKKTTQYHVDILDMDALNEMLLDFKPDVLFHLAGISDVGFSFKQPEITHKINVEGTKNVIESAFKLEKKPKILMVGSAMEYGIPQFTPITEDHPLNPSSPYAKSKVEAEKIAKEYCDKGMEIISTRSFNHTGPGQSPNFVSSSFAREVAKIEKGLQKPDIKVGNLSSKRDFTDVRDIVKAYVDLVEKGKSGESYNVCSGKGVSMQKILDVLLSITSVEVFMETDEERIRPSDVPISIGDNTKLKEDTGWVPKINLERTLYDLLNYWRENV
ncbi:GDP-mannose 4,6-dehydratase [archaeon]|nr:GDP-mannose 4,6-dehydratase [archaeon]MBT4351569.1 GDP-mannose 4,6-dehydratase [archaeon]MBT4648613.1 GDP-mannose 4,6-dehydratase [archaeon]MBT6821443.1 GDP-mannose 4,6-dehydratase [archaeon]MBT7393037.1 GDP-mannose 4,6-dehydratase [archaeon]